MSMRHGAKPPVMLSNTTRMPQLLAVPPTALAVPATGNTVGAVYYIRNEAVPNVTDADDANRLLDSIQKPIDNYIKGFENLYVRSHTNELRYVNSEGDCLYEALFRLLDFHRGRSFINPHYVYDTDHSDAMTKIDKFRTKLAEYWSGLNPNEQQEMFRRHQLGQEQFYNINLPKPAMATLTDVSQVPEYLTKRGCWGSGFALELAAKRFEVTIVLLFHEEASFETAIPPVLQNVYTHAVHDRRPEADKGIPLSPEFDWSAHEKYWFIVHSYNHYEFYVSKDLYTQRTGQELQLPPPEPASNPYSDKAAGVVSKDDLLRLTSKGKGKQADQFSQASASEQSKEDSDLEHEVLRAQFPEQVKRQQELDRAGNNTDPGFDRALERSARESMPHGELKKLDSILDLIKMREHIRKKYQDIQTEYAAIKILKGTNVQLYANTLIGIVSRMIEEDERLIKVAQEQNTLVYNKELQNTIEHYQTRKLENETEVQLLRETKFVAALLADYDANEKVRKQLYSQLADEKLGLSERQRRAVAYDETISKMQTLRDDIIHRLRNISGRAQTHNHYNLFLDNWLRDQMKELNSIPLEPFMHSMKWYEILTGEYKILELRRANAEEGLSAAPLPGLSDQDIGIMISNLREEREGIIAQMRHIRDSIVNILKKWYSREDLLEQHSLQREIDGWLNKPSLDQTDQGFTSLQAIYDTFERVQLALDNLKRSR